MKHARLLPDEERTVEDMAATLLDQGRARSTEELAQRICKRNRDLDQTAVLAHLRSIARQGALERPGRGASGNGATSAHVDLHREKPITSADFADIGQHTRLPLRAQHLFDSLVLQLMNRLGEEHFMKLIGRLQKEFPQFSLRAGKPIFTYMRVYGSVMRLAEQGELILRKASSGRNSSWIVKRVVHVPLDQASERLMVRSSAERNLGPSMPAHLVEELKGLEATRDRMLLEVAKVVRRIEVLRFDVFCQAFARVTEGS